MPQAQGRKAHLNEAKFKFSHPLKASFIFIWFLLQLAFRDLYNVFCVVEIKFQNSNTKAAA